MKRIPVTFYANVAGREPVREWLLKQSDDDRKIIGDDLRTLEFGWPIGMPLCRSMGSGLWETRHELTGNRIARILFVISDNSMILLHAFIKKSKKTPSQDLTIAQERRKEVEST